MSGDDDSASNEDFNQSESSSDSEEDGSSHSSCQWESSGGENDGELNIPDEIMDDIEIEVVSGSGDDVRSDLEVCLNSFRCTSDFMRCHKNVLPEAFIAFAILVIIQPRIDYCKLSELALDDMLNCFALQLLFWQADEAILKFQA